MEVKCEYCGSLIPDNAAKCPNCGATNTNMNRAADSTPKTIAELEQWYRDRNLPPYEVTRFFIGIDYKGPKAFGIYQDGDQYIVYKNKADGSRAVRYRGTDEDYAVNELFLKLKSEILNQRERQRSPRTKKKSAPVREDDSESHAGHGKTIALTAFILISIASFLFSWNSPAREVTSYAVIAAIIGIVVGCSLFKRHKKTVTMIVLILLTLATLAANILNITEHTPRYYVYDDIPYVWNNGDYYEYDYDIDEYTPVYYEDVPADLYDDPDYYAVGGAGEINASEFSESDQYESWLDSLHFDGPASDSDWDSDYSWDSDDDWSSSDWDSDYDWGSDWSWDFGDTDWGSDW